MIGACVDVMVVKKDRNITARWYAKIFDGYAVARLRECRRPKNDPSRGKNRDCEPAAYRANR